jgi:hypothetical protein
VGRPGFISKFEGFSLTQTLKFETVTFPTSKIHQTLHRDILKDKEQLSFLSQLQIPSELQVKNSGTKINFESSSNSKGVQTFLKKSGKFFKIPSSHGILKYTFKLAHLYSNIGSSFTSENRYFVNFRLNNVGILRRLPQLHHDSNLDKVCSQVIYKSCNIIWMTYTI